MNFPREDRVQFAQLIGYSYTGFGELSYVREEDHYAAAHTDFVDPGRSDARLALEPKENWSTLAWKNRAEQAESRAAAAEKELADVRWSRDEETKRCVAAEKRAKEAEEYVEGLQLTIEEQRKNMAGFIAERDALKAKLAAVIAAAKGEA
jgi:hypothetical protein